MYLQEKHYLYFHLGVKVTRNVAQYPLHHMTYAAVKFEVARPNSLGGDTITRNIADAQTDGMTDFGKKLIYSFFLKKKAGMATVYELINELFENFLIIFIVF